VEARDYEIDGSSTVLGNASPKQTVTNDNGEYLIYYSASQLVGNKNLADLKIHAYNINPPATPLDPVPDDTLDSNLGIPVVSSAILYNAPEHAEVNLIISPKRFVGETEYSRITVAMTAAFDSSSLSVNLNNIQSADISNIRRLLLNQEGIQMLSNKTGFDNQTIRRFLTSIILNEDLTKDRPNGAPPFLTVSLDPTNSEPIYDLTEVIYGLLFSELPTDLKRLVSSATEEDTTLESLLNAIKYNKIDDEIVIQIEDESRPVVDALVADFTKALTSLGLVDLNSNENGELEEIATPIKSLMDHVGLSSAKQVPLLQFYADNASNPSLDLWTEAVDEGILSATESEDMRRIFQYYAVSGNHIPITKYFYTNYDQLSAMDLLTKAELESIIRLDLSIVDGGDPVNKVIGVPGIETPSDENIADYAAGIEQTIDGLFSTSRFANAINQSTPDELDQKISDFLSANTYSDAPQKTFDLSKSVTSYLKEYPEALDGFATEEEKGLVRSTLYMYKSLYQLLLGESDSKFLQIKELISLGYRSGADILKKSEGAFIASIESSFAQFKSPIDILQEQYAFTKIVPIIETVLVTEPPKYPGDIPSRRYEQKRTYKREKAFSKIIDVKDYGAFIYKKGTEIVAKAVNLQAMLNDQALVGVIKNNLPTSLEEVNDNPEVKVLFGSQDYCQCTHCQSSQSPAAYLVDVLEFIKEAQNKNQHSNDTAWDILQTRRPDLAKLDLSCANTNTVMPYIDLVNEVLEYACYAHRLDQDSSISDTEKNELLQKAADRQTTKDASTVRVAPEHIETSVYEETLSKAIYPWVVPFHLWNQEAKAYLGAIEMDRSEIVRTTQGDSDAFAGISLEEALIQLGISEKQQQIFADNSYTEYYGGVSSYTQLQNVENLLKRSALSFDEFNQLIETQYINPVGPSYPLKHQVQFAVDPETSVESCKIEDAAILFTNADYFKRLHWFTRLQRIVDWSIEDLDATIEAFSIGEVGTINNGLFVHIAGINQLKNRFSKLEIQDILTWYGFMSDRSYKGKVSAFTNIFANTKSLQEASIYEAILAANSTPIPLLEGDTDDQLVDSEIVSALLGVYKITSKELTQLAISEGIINANQSDLVKLYGIVSFANALELSINEYLSWTKFFPSSQGIIGNDPNDTLTFLAKYDEIINSGLLTQDLDYLFGNVFSGAYSEYSEKPSQTLIAIKQLLVDQLGTKSINVTRSKSDLVALFSMFFTEDLIESFIELVEDGIASIPHTDNVRFPNGKVENTIIISEYWEEIIGNAASQQLATDLQAASGLSKEEKYQSVFNNFHGALSKSLDLKNKVIGLLSDDLGTSADMVSTLAGQYILDQSQTLVERLASADFIYDSTSIDDPTFDGDRRQLDKLNKLALAIDSLNINIKDLRLLFSHSLDTGWFNLLSELPLTGEVAISIPTSFLSLVKALRYNSVYTVSDFSFLGLIQEVMDGIYASPEDIYTKLGEQMEWSKDELLAAVNLSSVQLLSINDFTSERWMSLLIPVMELSQKIGVSPDKLNEWASQDLDSQKSKAIIGAVKSKFSDKVWDTTGAEIRDLLRKQQRDALADYLIAVVTDDDADKQKFKDRNALYAHYLLDIDMEPCFMISRLKLAISTVQLWVQRIRMNLEPNLDFAAEDMSEWSWRKNYRVWEAARKVFMYPENWAEPELRDNTSVFFDEMLDELLQNEVTDKAVEKAYLGYLEKLHNVAHLEVMATFTDNDSLSNDTHVWARTKNQPHIYYYRKWINNTDWTGWEPMGIEIEGNHLIPVKYNGRIVLFWASMTLRSDSENENLPDTLSSNTKGTKPIQKINIKLYKTELHDKVWSAKKLLNGECELDTEFSEIENVHFHREENEEVTGIQIGINYFKKMIRSSIKQAGSLNINHYLNSFLYNEDLNHFFKHVRSDEKLKNQSSLVDPFIVVRASDKVNVIPFLNAPNQDELRLVTHLSTNHLDYPTLIEDDSRSFFTRKSSEKLNIIDFYAYHLNGGNGPITLFQRRLGLNRESFTTLQIDNTEFYKLPSFDKMQGAFNDFLLSHFDLERILQFFKLDLDLDSASQFDLYRNYKLRENRKIELTAYLPYINKEVILKAYNYTERLWLEWIDEIDWESDNRRKVLENHYSTQALKEAYNRLLTVDLSTRSLYQNIEDLVLVSFEAAQDKFGDGYLLSDEINLKLVESYKYHIVPNYHRYTSDLIAQINKNGINGILSPKLNTSLGRLIYRQQGSEEENKYSFKEVYNPEPSLFATKYERDSSTGKIVKVPDYPDDGFAFGSYAPYGIYNWELFFHVPMLIADKLSQDQKFEEAQKWYHTIFDPTEVDGEAPSRYWKLKPFYEYVGTFDVNDIMLKMSQGDPEFAAQIDQWSRNPFEPHRVARLRTSAYMKNTVMKYLDNLIAWGDHLFTRDTIESLNEATQIYILASDILGPKPVQTGKKTRSALAVEDVIGDGGAFSNPLVKIEAEINSFIEAEALNNDGINVLRTALYFCNAPNDKLLGYWDTVADRLFKIRNCLNIEGVFRSLPLFQPPIDPALLVKASAAGISIGEVLDGISGANLPHYRFRVLIQKAIELCNDMKGLGQGLLSALEKKDAEELALLRASQEVTLLKATKEIKKQSIKENELSLEGLEDAKVLAEKRKKYYSSRKYMNHQEKQQLKKMDNAMKLQLAGQIAGGLASALALIPNFEAGIAGAFGSPFVTVNTGGAALFNSLQGAKLVLDALSQVQSHKASVAGIKGGYDRRRDDWKFQADMAITEIQQSEKQIAAAEIRLALSERELVNHELQITQSEEAQEFMKSKYTNRQLYSWMITQTSKLYFQSYQLAMDVARMAERAYARELGVDNPAFVQFGHWDSLKKGLLAGERLQADLRKMEIAYLEQNKREYEITKHVPLSVLSPIQLLRLREEGVADFHVPEALFDLDFPGQYKRRIKSVRLTIPAVTGPYTNVSAKLTLLSSRTRKNTDLNTNSPKYSFEGNNDTRFDHDLGGIQSIATSSAQNDAGLFELNFNDERYLPFEGAGAISNWRLELPTDMRAFDYDTISDVIVHIGYTAKDGGDKFKTEVKNDIQLGLNNYADWLQSSGEAQSEIISLKTQFPNALNDLLTEEDSSSTSIDITQMQFPHFLSERDLKMNYAVLMVKSKGTQDFTTIKADIIIDGKSIVTGSVEESSSETVLTSASGPYPFDYLEGQNFSNLSPVDNWKIKIDSTALDFTNTEVDDILLLIDYKL
ncbi:Tc toxin subunit A-related protein, partial [Reichenbachiella versicolor]|uniref:Tc toxin subunit A-related protein n=1 Tax=Reichenbachiella versicolor TaxID=1821036 RepID=UPI001C87890E